MGPSVEVRLPSKDGQRLENSISAQDSSEVRVAEEWIGTGVAAHAGLVPAVDVVVQEPRVSRRYSSGPLDVSEVGGGGVQRSGHEPRAQHQGKLSTCPSLEIRIDMPSTAAVPVGTAEST